jgi:hypothetical protein
MAVEQRSGEASARPLSEKEHWLPRVRAGDSHVRTRPDAADVARAARGR